MSMKHPVPRRSYPPSLEAGWPKTLQQISPASSKENDDLKDGCVLLKSMIRVAIIETESPTHGRENS